MPGTSSILSPGHALPAFDLVANRIAAHARLRPTAPALDDGQVSIDYARLDASMDRIAAAHQRDGMRPGEVVALCGRPSTRYAQAFLGALRGGFVVAPLPPSVTRESLAAMLRDSGARRVFLDAAAMPLLPEDMDRSACISLDDAAPGVAFESWLAPAGVPPAPVSIGPSDPFNIIYSSGTTGTPKGIVQSHGMRWVHVRRGLSQDYSPETRTQLATPLYSNTTLVAFFPTLAFGGAVYLMSKFDVPEYLSIAQRRRITHTMLVPVQYQRIMGFDGFGDFDLSSFRVKFCTSAPFPAALKADVLARWPGGLVEFYGMTEGGGSCVLDARAYPDKLHTVGRPAEGSDIRLIDEEGREVAAGQTGEVVGHSASMMTGYHNQPGKTREAEWFDACGKRFIRTGDVGRIDSDGFLTLIDRRKDMIISGGFNIYPADIEAELRRHPAVADAAVIGVPSSQWGETPVAYVILRDIAAAGGEILGWYNRRAGKFQRLAELYVVAAFPRSALGKVLKRELRARYTEGARATGSKGIDGCSD